MDSLVSGGTKTHTSFAPLPFILSPDGDGGRGEGASLFLHKKFQILSVSLFLQILFRNEPQRCRIHAVTKARRRRPVIEDVAEMEIAMFAPDLDAGHEKAMVFPLHDIPRLKGLGEARPSGPGIIFVLGAEQRLPGNDVDINPFSMVIPVLIPERGFGALFLSHLILHGGQEFL